jgi:hypothetical protein
MSKLVRLLTFASLAVLLAGPALAAAQAPGPVYESPASGMASFAPPFGPAAHYSWSPEDADWLSTNRHIALAGKLLTVVGRLSLFGAVIAGADFRDPTYWACLATANTGELMWSIADLRAVNRLRERNGRTRRGAAIASLVGAFTLAPITWIAGPVASAQIREERGQLEGTAANGPGTRSAVARFDAYGAGLKLRF